jgi:PTS system ascorbate-specific IIC component
MDIVIGILKQPAIIIGLLALIGLIAQRAPLERVIVGTLKTSLGFAALFIGVNAIIAAIGPFSGMFVAAFGLTGIIASDEAAVGAIAGELGSEIAMVMGLSFVVSLIWARITPFKNIYLSGHKQFGICGTAVLALWALGVNSTVTVIVGSIVIGIYMATFPSIIQPFTREVSGTDDWAIGHVYTLNILLTSLFAKLLGNKKRSVDEIEYPKGLEFFRDMAATTFVVFALVFLITSLIAGPEKSANFTAGTHWILFPFWQAIQVTAGVLVLIYGVKMFLAEIIPAFKGIADKIIPGARPALDVPVLFPFSPNGMIIGFVVTFISWLAGMAVGGALTGIISIPSMTGCFFGGATAGVYGAKLGGRRGAFIAAIVHGFHWPILTALFYKVLPMTHFVDGIGYLCQDNMFIGVLITGIGKLFGLG